MKKNRQQELTNWLKKQSIHSIRWINLSKFLGVVNSLLIVTQSWVLASVLHNVIIEKIPRRTIFFSFISLLLIFLFRSLVLWLREKVGFYIGQHIRYEIRKKVLNKLQKAGPAWIYSKPIGNWITLLLEHIENLHDYYAHYLPQTTIAIYVPLIISITLLMINWVAALILLCTAPLIPLFMVMVGMNAAESNRRNFLALARLGGHFFDRLCGMETLRLFDYGNIEIENIRSVSQDFHQKTMEVLRLAFLSSGILEFFTSLSIGLVATYFGFSYLGDLNFGYYGNNVTLLSGFFALILSSEFFQPLRDLGMFYHSKAQAIGAADSLQTFLETPLIHPQCGEIMLHEESDSICVTAEDLVVLSPEGKVLIGPLNFTISTGQRIALVGMSGSGKSSLINVLSGFLPYTGSLRMNHMELRTLNLKSLRKLLSWVGQKPHLISSSLRDNILLGCPNISEKDLNFILEKIYMKEFLSLFPDGIHSMVEDQNIVNLSIGQIQRIAIARALLKPCKLLLLDEPTANLDVHSEQQVMHVLNNASRSQTTLMVTHRLYNIIEWDQIWVMENGKIVEQGHYMNLCELQGAFFTLANSHRREI